LSRIEPPEIQVALDMPVNKELPVQVDWVGALPDGYILESVSVVPDSVMVVGAQRTLDQIDTIYTEKVRLENLQGSGHKTVSLTIEPSSIKIVEGYKDKVDVRFTIRRRAAP
jgi:diadenylate cyclase